MLTRHSSRRSRLDQAVLKKRLEGAVSYDRIAGYFRSSLFEVAGEALASVTGPVRIICNSDLDPQDLITAAAAQAALRRNWCAGKPEDAPPAALPRYRALYAALTSKKMEVRVLPDSAFGLIHGKAGVVRRADGSATAFMGSVNESLSAWKLNYELLWEDDSPEAIAWVQEEFDALWNDARGKAGPALDRDRGAVRRRVRVQRHRCRDRLAAGEAQLIRIGWIICRRSAIATADKYAAVSLNRLKKGQCRSAW